MNEMVIEQNKLKEIIEKYDEFLEDTKLENKNVYKLHPDKEEAEKKKLSY